MIKIKINRRWKTEKKLLTGVQKIDFLQKKMFCNIVFPSVVIIFEKHLRTSSFLVQLNFTKNSFTGICQGFWPQVFSSEYILAEHLAVTALREQIMISEDIKGFLFFVLIFVWLVTNLVAYSTMCKYSEKPQGKSCK